MLCLRKLSNFARKKRFGNVRWISSEKRGFKEVSIEVPWGYVAGKWWEPYDTRPILTLHGWQDNCGSFDRIIPMLDKNVGFLAVDLPGHGFSSRIPKGMVYHHFIYFLTIKSIAKSLNWPSISFMGHSMGGILSYVNSMFYPDETDLLICIDGVKPMVRNESYAAVSNSLEQFFKYNNFADDLREPPSYTLEELKILVSQPNGNSILPKYTTYIIDRNIAPSKIHPGKFYFTRDPRVKATQYITMPQEHIVKLAERMKMPIFIAKVKESTYYEKKENFYEVIDVLKKVNSELDFHYVEGRHHVHLNYPENISELINKFINRHNTQNRSIGGIREDFIKDIKPSLINKSS